MHIALFITCFNDMMFPRTGHAVTELLERLGHTVEFPQSQTCCGQMHFNTGYRVRAVGAPRRRPRRHRRRRPLPPPGHLPPDLLLLRMLRVGGRPLRLLRAVKGIDLVELTAAESCCGFGGTFALKNAVTDRERSTSS
ncbi:hypothetical protein ADL12_23345 [Streptomyces regalis]|uniref:Cysteine-rich domain-containing protein n=1 Tax=Streptomyces regalis TaxID=68262 RepID=A0A101JTH2_9ACTN|nr:hypothetical protein ADL12_23345 [Streptomyces regalis]